MSTFAPRHLFATGFIAVMIVWSTPVAARAPDAAGEEARAAFRDLLQLTDDAATRHYLVAKPEWMAMQARWEHAARGHSRLARQLARCAPPLKAARAGIARAHRLFTAARRRTDDTFALIAKHKRLLARASVHVHRARACFTRVLRRVIP